MIKFLLIITSWWIMWAERPSAVNNLYNYEYGAGFEANHGRVRTEMTLLRIDGDYYKHYDVSLIPYKLGLLGVKCKCFHDDLRDVDFQEASCQLGSLFYVGAGIRTQKWEDAIKMAGVGISGNNLQADYKTNFKGKFNFTLTAKYRFDFKKKGYYLEPEYKRAAQEEGKDTWSRQIKFGYEEPQE